MSVTPEIEAEIMARHRRSSHRFSPFKVGRAVGCSTQEVIDVVNRHRGQMADGSEHNGGKGRPDLQDYIRASRRVNAGGWDNSDVGVRMARRAYEAGTHTMATHRDGAWLHLCSIPLRRPVKARPGYFTGKAIV